MPVAPIAPHASGHTTVTAEGDRGTRHKRPREESAAPAQNAPAASPLDTILEHRANKSLDTILETQHAAAATSLS